MNNATIKLEEQETSNLEQIEKRRGELSQVVEAINRIEQTEDWQKLKKLLFDGVVESLERQLKNEAESKEIDVRNLYLLQGQLAWAKRYANLKGLSEFFRLQVESLKTQIHEKNPTDGAV